MPSSPLAPPDDLVTFNVRGRHFQTTITTLRRFPDSVLFKMMEYAEPQHQSTLAARQTPGSFFIDRDPDLFSAILRYHDMVEFDIESLCTAGSANTVTRKLLSREAEYYNIQSLLDSITNITQSSLLVRYQCYVFPPSKYKEDKLFQHDFRHKPFELSEEIGKSYTASALDGLQYADYALLVELENIIFDKTHNSDDAGFRWTLWKASCQEKNNGMVIVIKGDRKQ
jgi:hypothetical protein